VTSATGSGIATPTAALCHCPRSKINKHKRADKHLGFDQDITGPTPFCTAFHLCCLWTVYAVMLSACKVQLADQEACGSQQAMKPAKHATLAGIQLPGKSFAGWRMQQL
jgi:hypothetical protein